MTVLVANMASPTPIATRKEVDGITADMSNLVSQESLYFLGHRQFFEEFKLWDRTRLICSMVCKVIRIVGKLGKSFRQLIASQSQGLRLFFKKNSLLTYGSNSVIKDESVLFETSPRIM